jgi:hypothetical protein
MKEKVINTKQLLDGTFYDFYQEKLDISITNKKSISYPSPIKNPPTSTLSSVEIDKQMIYNAPPVQPKTISPPGNSSPSVVPKTNSSDAQSDTPLYETRPSGFKMAKWGYYGSKNNPKSRNIKKGTSIYLHHTANNYMGDKGKGTYSSWYNEGNPKHDNSWSACAHAVIDELGNIEYGTPLEYMAITQGNTTSLNYEHSNIGNKNKKDPKKAGFKDANAYGIGCEVENYGFFKYPSERNGVQGWQRKKNKGTWFSEEKYNIVEMVDFDLKPITFKTQKRCIEFPQVQCDAIEKWLRETLKAIDLEDWKFTRYIYKQMFPNMGRSKFVDRKIKNKTTKKRESNPLYSKVLWMEKDDLYIIGGSKNRWAISKDAMEGVRGVYTHSSVTSTKTDLCPTPNIIKMLKKFT